MQFTGWVAKQWYVSRLTRNWYWVLQKYGIKSMESQHKMHFFGNPRQSELRIPCERLNCNHLHNCFSTRRTYSKLSWAALYFRILKQTINIPISFLPQLIYDQLAHLSFQSPKSQLRDFHQSHFPRICEWQNVKPYPATKNPKL